MKKLFLIILLFCSFNLFSQSIPTPDSLKLIVEIYHFNDYNSIDTFGIDTSQRHIEIFETPGKSLLPIINLGQIGTPSLPIIFAQRSNFEDFMFLDPYIDFLLKPEELNYYKTNNPYTDFKYIGASKIIEQQTLSFIHTQTFGENNFGLKYEMLTAKDLSSDNQNSSINNLNLWYHKTYKKYDIYAGIFSNKIKKLENGGVIDTPVYNYEAPSYILDNANNVLIYRGLYLNQKYSLSDKFKFRHIFNYKKLSKTFFENSLNNDLGTPMLSSKETYDSVGIISYENTIDAQFLNNLAVLDLSFTNKLQRFYYFRGFLYDLKGEFHTDNVLKLSVSKLKLSTFFFSNTIAEYHLTERKSGDYKLNSQQFIKLGQADSSIVFSFEETIEKQRPGYFYEHYNGNYDYWINSFEKINNFSLTGKINLNKYHFEIGGDFRQYNNYIYFDSVAQPQQLSEKLTITTLWAKKTFYFGPFVSDLNFYWQKSNQPQKVNIPEYIGAGSLYANFPVFKKAANINIGVNLTYTSAFYMYSYKASTGVFYLKNGRLTGTYPFVNLFFTAKVKTAIIILRFDNATALRYDFDNSIIIPQEYSTVENYLTSKFYLRFGVRWWFRN
ncbi:MAG: hypothetical protein JXL97_12525 [Bacteroidales bacterium]|nr:hypothetical protein [Bacteroidales bacterium]